MRVIWTLSRVHHSTPASQHSGHAQIHSVSFRRCQGASKLTISATSWLCILLLYSLPHVFQLVMWLLSGIDIIALRTSTQVLDNSKQVPNSVDADHFHYTLMLIGHTLGLSLTAVFVTCSILILPTVMNVMFSQLLCHFSSNYPLYSPNLCIVHFQCPNCGCPLNQTISTIITTYTLNSKSIQASASFRLLRMVAIMS